MIFSLYNNSIIAVIIAQCVFFIPFICLLLKWRKSSILLKIIIIAPFLFSLYISFSIVASLVYNQEIYQEIDIDNLAAGQEYEFSFRHMNERYFLGLDIFEEQKNTNKWPTRDDISISLPLEALLVTDDMIFNSTTIGDLHSFGFGNLVEFNNGLFSHSKVTIKINNPPPANVKSMFLNIKQVYRSEMEDFYPLFLMLPFIAVYGILFVYFILKLGCNKFMSISNIKG